MPFPSILLWLGCATRAPAEAPPLTEAPAPTGAELYARYCALCHGDDREGYAADNAPSLRSPELMGAVPMGTLWQAVAWGRPGTPMAGFADSQGGPLDHQALHTLVDWLLSEAAVERVELEDVPVRGDAVRGAEIYAERCAACHGAEGEGVSAPALANRVALATTPDAFLRDTIARGRSGTPMPAFADVLGAEDLDAVTAFLRRRAVAWSAEPPTLAPLPSPEQALLNPDGPPAELTPRGGRFVAIDEVAAALEAGSRMVLLDARPASDWQRGHIPGALPVPFHDAVDGVVPHLPDDGTWIVVYCACPHAASGRVVDALRERGFERAVILDEGVLEWAARGLPMALGA